MPWAEPNLEPLQVLRRYQLIRRRFWILLLVAALVVFAPLEADRLAPELLAAGGAAFALGWAFVFTVVLVLFLYNWRCPVCGGFLGQRIWGPLGLKSCARCGVRLV